MRRRPALDLPVQRPAGAEGQADAYLPGSRIKMRHLLAVGEIVSTCLSPGADGCKEPTRVSFECNSRASTSAVEQY